MSLSQSLFNVHVFFYLVPCYFFLVPRYIVYQSLSWYCIVIVSPSRFAQYGPVLCCVHLHSLSASQLLFSLLVHRPPSTPAHIRITIKMMIIAVMISTFISPLTC